MAQITYLGDADTEVYSRPGGPPLIRIKMNYIDGYPEPMSMSMYLGNSGNADNAGHANFSAGWNALWNAQNVYSTIALGHHAGSGQLRGGNDVWIGPYAGTRAVDPYDCTVVGSGGAQELESGVGLCAFGRLAAAKTRVAGNIVAMGDSALHDAEYPLQLVGIGYKAGWRQKNTRLSVYIGPGTSFNENGGNECWVAGAFACQDGRGGHRWTVTGAYAARYKTEDDGTVYGHRGFEEVQVGGNTGIGSQVGRSVRYGRDNLMGGLRAGYHPRQAPDVNRTVVLGTDAYSDEDGQVVLNNLVLQVANDNLLRLRIRRADGTYTQATIIFQEVA